MYEYKSVKAHIPSLDHVLNDAAQEGWRLIQWCKEDEVFILEREQK